MKNLLSIFKFRNWFTERSNGMGFSIELERKILKKHSAYQKIEIYQTKKFGKLLLLDGKTMVTEFDEFVYHEMITHIPLNIHPNPERVLVIGGGDGGTVREVIKHPSVKEIILVEIDQDVIRYCQQEFPTLSCALNDPKVEILCQDGIEYIRKNVNYFDIIIIDSSDPENFALNLFLEPFYQDVYQALRPDGIMTNQTDGLFVSPERIQKTYHAMNQVFPHLFMYTAECLIYPGVFWSFGFASKKYHPLKDFHPQQNDQKQLITKYYNTLMHTGAFYLPNFVLDLLPENCEQRSWKTDTINN